LIDGKKKTLKKEERPYNCFAGHLASLLDQKREGPWHGGLQSEKGGIQKAGKKNKENC